MSFITTVPQTIRTVDFVPVGETICATYLATIFEAIGAAVSDSLIAANRIPIELSINQVYYAASCITSITTDCDPSRSTVMSTLTAAGY